ncbi:RNA-directed DNA polymerase (reverse transcriptase)-related family protein [Rhynchospora pubera]|uniref:RNA-directed DNA polymerase (Reverse transcriptase)-related family protein n=1 Tax=Rhynchospora pubera TaxID=906938 RepID=A0AAV8EST5_9POAL|nr:RNA-directed DNA polymerase (reverse transcriptase)-related family protein [Rhynchospora pubera]
MAFFQDLRETEGKSIPASGHTTLEALPDFQKVKRAVFQMGPDKSPGPDGVTARFIQKYWNIIGPDLVQQIKQIFHTGWIPDDWLKCNIILIPKGDEPETPSQFRPISIGNVLYRLIMKILTNRLRPHMKKLIAQEQTAFLHNRCISDNVLLIKEVLNSFNTKKFKHHAFMLKADITKAFDKLNWNFLEHACNHVNMPRKITRMMISAYQRAKVTILINGTGDGFITPSRGLRQGCPMSPYMFILAMEMMSRIFKKALQAGHLRGLKLAPTAQPLTHSIYADDLLIMGATHEGEITAIKNILEDFGGASGLVVNPIKSKLWFSKATPLEVCQRIKQSLRAINAEEGEKYLGVCLSGRNSARKTGQMLLERMWSKLAGWKCSMLSHAGRLVLIKSVLTSLPVYYMNTERIPKGLIDQMMSLMEKFFWGKTEKARYLSFISWKKVCTKIEDGGLGVKNLHKFGEALFLKNVRALMGQHDKIWVDICRAKYFPRVGFWGATNTRGASQLWREVVKFRAELKDDVCWHISNGMKAKAVSQPWYQGWQVQSGAPSTDIMLTVGGLVDTQTNQWKEDQLVRLFGLQCAVQIQNTIQIPDQNSDLNDTLIWKKTKEGRYSVKHGYAWRMERESYTEYVGVNESHWIKIDRIKNIVPKVKLFLWRLLSGTLTIAQNLNKRIRAISPMCQRCNSENEFECHCFFFCPGSRAVWFGSPLMLRVHELPLNIIHAFTHITEELDQQGMAIFSYTMWELWKGRNEVVMQHKNFNPIQIRKNVMAWISENGHNTVQPTLSYQEAEQKRYEVTENEWQMLVDGSWDVTGKAGTAFVLYKEGTAHCLAYNYHQAQNPFHAEAIAFLEAIKALCIEIELLHTQKVCIHTDCQRLVNAILEEETDNLPSWKAVPAVHQSVQLANRLGNRFRINYACREAIQPAHVLANYARGNRNARVINLVNQGTLAAWGISTALDRNFFPNSVS